MEATVGPSWNPVRATANARADYQLRASKSSGDLIAELKAHIGATGGGPLPLRRVNRTSHGSSTVYSAVPGRQAATKPSESH